MVIIRHEKSEDVSTIHHVIAQAFGQSDEADLVDALRRNGHVTLSLVAESDGQIVGHILFSLVRVESEAGECIGVGLAPLAVLPEFQNRRIGSLLAEHGLKQCQAAGHPFAVVLGHPNYYPRFGFSKASRFGIKCEFDVSDEYFMAIELHEGALQNQAGIARFQPEFKDI